MSKNPILHGPAILAVLFLSWAEVCAFQTPATAPLPDFDRRAAASAVSGDQQTATNTLRARLPGAQVEFDPLSGAPSLVSTEFGFLSGPNGQGKAISASAAAAVGAADPNRATRAFLLEHRQLFGHGPEVLDAARVKREFVTPHNGLKTVVWEQQVEGIPVYEALLISHTTGNGELVNLSSHFVPDPPAAAALDMSVRTTPFAPVDVSARRAVAIAVRAIGEQIEEESVLPGEVVGGAEKRQQFEAAVLAGAADAGLVWLPMGRDRMRLCWDVILTSKARGEMFRVLVDIETGEPLIRRCLTVYLSDATYRVYTSDSPSPFSPGHPTPQTTQPAAVPRSLLTLSALNTTASPNGWIDDGVNETRGNNVDAHADRNANNAPDLPRPQGSPSRVFDFPLDLAQSPLTYSNAAIVQLFYWNNFMHDKLYELGFTEAAGNFQNNNFGRGGAGNDAVQADAQDGSGTDNANFSTPPDGSAGRMQMYLFTGPTPDRDGDLDAEVILHEYAHGLSNRRVGGGVGLSALQSGGMGEGWSDFYGLALLSEPGDDFNGVYAAGGYLTYQLSGLLQNYYYGIRRYPYCTDTNKNPLTFRDIDPAQASAHAGVPRSPIIGTTANEVHNMGEVWCVTLWEARAKLINKHGWAVGNQLILRLVTDGMNLSVANPNFLQARNAILQADQVNNGGANLGELWAAFAKRGMGFSATSPSSSTTAGLHEAFDVPFLPLNLTLPAAATEGDSILVGRISVPTAPTTNLVISLVSSDPSQIIVSSGATMLAGQTNVLFLITVVDDLDLDGTRNPTITATAPGYAVVSASLPVYDNETATLSLTVPTDATEGNGTVVATVNVSAVPAADIQVTLVSSDTTEIQVPPVVTIPAGQTSAPFNPAIVDDTQIDGDQVATLTAQVVNWTAGVATMTVHDNESTGLTVRLPAVAREGDGLLVGAGSVYIAGTLPTNRLVTLSSDDTTELLVATGVIILAGQTNATFSLGIVNDAVVDGTQTARVTATAPGFTSGLASMLIFDDESPLPPSNPRPGDLAVNVPANTNLAWDIGTGGERILNGGFENGTLDNWVLVSGQSLGQFQVNNGTFDPPSPDGPLPTFSGGYSAVATEIGPGAFYMYQDVTIPAGSTFATLNWAHRVRNFFMEFSSLQQFRVEVRNTNNAILAVAFTTNPGDPLLGDWVQKSFSLTPYIGQKVRIAFWLNPGGFFLDAHLDNISVQTGSPPDPGVTNDVYFGTNPTPGPAEFQGSTPGTSWQLPLLAPQTTYYWQIISRKVGTTVGPVWQFTTRGVDHFVWDPVSSPQLLNQPFPARITARDESNRTVTNFNGSVNLSATSGVGGLVTNVILGNLSHESIGNGNYTLGYAFTPTTNITVTHVRHYFGTKVSIWSDNCVVLASQNVVSTPGTWVETPLTTPVQLLSGVRYKVGVFNASLDYYWRTTIPTTFPNGAINQSIFGSADVCPSLDATGGWAMLDLKYTTGAGELPVPILPTVANFTDGVWSGNPVVLQPATNVVLRASDGAGHVGSSNPFEVGVTNDISVSIVDLPDPISVGTALTYTLKVANTGPADATGVNVSNQLPVGVTFVSANASQGNCTQSGGVVTCDLGLIPGGSNATITIVVVPTTAGTTIINRATVTRAEADAFLGNNTAVATTTVTTPAISIGDASVVEGNIGQANIFFPLTLASPSAQTITVSYATTNESAVAGVDYAGTNGVASFLPGTTNASIRVVVLGETAIESNETFFVKLTGPVNGTLARTQAVGTIINDDGLPGQVNRFVWQPVASPQYASVPFGVSISALDAQNHVASNFTGTVTFSGGASTFENGDFEAGTLAPWLPLNASPAPGPYDLVPFDVNGDGIASTAFRIAANAGAPDGITRNVTLTGGVNYTVAMDVAAYNQNAIGNIDPGAVSLLIGGTTVAGKTFIGPIASSQVMRGNLTGSYTPPASGTYALTLRFTRAYLEAPGVWIFADDLRLSGQTALLTIAPGNSGPFTNGIWSGNLVLSQAETNVVLIANDGNGHTGSANAIDVLFQNDLTLAMADVPDPVSVGANLTYSLAVSNNGPLTATSVVVSNILPASVSFVSAVSSQGTCTESAGMVRCNLGTIPGAASATITIVAIPRIGGITISNRATVYRAETDPDFANNTAVALTSVARVDHFEWSAIAPTQYVNVAFAATVTARHADNGLATNFFGLVAFSGSGAVLVSPNFVGNFSNGIWSGNITVLSAAASMTLRAQDTNGHFGISNPFMASSGCAPPGTPANPTPADGATGVALTASLGWSVGALAELSPPAPEVAAPGNYPIASDGSVVQATFIRNGMAVPGEVWGRDIPQAAPRVEAGEQLGATTISFDDLSAPCIFFETTRLTTLYTALGVTFAGPGGNDGGAILNQCGSFGVSGFSPPNFLAFNTVSAMADGGVPRGPETLHFATEVSQVSMLIGSGISPGQPLTVLAYDSASALVSSNSFVLSSVMASVSIPGAGITRLVVSSPASVFVIDDVSFTPNECPLTYDVYFGTNNPPTDLAAAALTNTTYIPNLLVPATTYYWRVIARSDVGETPGPVWRFTTVVPQAPTIEVQPASQTVYVGDSPVLEVQAEGAPPLRYQWTFNGMNLLGATNASLTLANVQLSQGGYYAVRVSNALGSMLSSTAVLIVNVRPLCAAPQGLVSWWRAETNALDSVSGNHGTLQGGAGFATGESGESFLFNGFDSFVRVPSSPSIKPTGPFTLEAWVNYDQITGPNGGTVVMKGPDAEVPGDWAISVSSIRRLRPHVNLNGGWNYFDCATTLSTGVWYHVAMVYDGAAIRGFVNGVQDGIQIVSGTVRVSDNPMKIGTYASLNSPSTTSFFAGRIDELSFYNRALSNSEIQAVYQAGSAGKCGPAGGVPVITGFSPASGSAGASVAITGLNFSPVPSNNIVYFGAVKAFVTAASPTLLNVIIPVGATYAPITETVSGLTAYSRAPFLPTYAGSGTINSSSLAPRVTLPTGLLPDRTEIGDLDGDGKADVATANTLDGTIWVYRNVSTSGALETNSFAAPVILRLPGPSDYQLGLALADLDGDGRLDVVTAYGTSNFVSVFKNLSSPGNIATNSFSARLDYPTGAGANHIAVQDLDADGKPEVVTANLADNTVSVLRNIGAPGILNPGSFAAPVNFAAGSGPAAVTIADLDGDGKPDLATANANSGSGAMSVFRNVSTPGSITPASFAARVDFAGPDSTVFVATGDLDRDGKQDLILASFLSGQAISVYRNTATPGTINAASFAARVDFSVGAWAHTVAVGDLDGDGKPDVAVASESPDRLSLFKNTSSPGTFTTGSFAPRVDFPTGYNAWGVSIGDLDGDGRSDLTLVNAYDNTMSVYRNLIPAAPVGGSNLDHFTWNHVPSPQFVNVPFPVTIQAHGLNQSASDFAGIVALSGTSDDWTANALVPGLSGGFVDGVWSGTVAVSHSGSNLVLRAEDGLGHSGLANPIAVINPPGLQAVHSGNNLTITWPVEPAGFTLETSTDLSNWVPAPATWVQVGNQQVFEVDLSETSRFYRLRFDRP